MGSPASADSVALAAFADLTSKPYKEQAIWFLNAFWVKDLNLSSPENGETCEKIWTYSHTCAALDPNKDEGNELDEFNAHRLLEKLETALTVTDMREKFRKINPSLTSSLNAKKFSLTEFLVFKYNVDWKYLVRAPQASAGDIAQWQAAEDKVRQAQISVQSCKETEKVAKEKESAQKDAEKAVKAALAEIQKEEEAFNKQKADLEATSKNEALGIVKRNKASHELHQLLASDPLPLKTAKISQEAAVRKQERATRDAVNARAAAQASVQNANKILEEVTAVLDELKNTATAGLGKVWWMQRELEEAKKYMSKKQLQKFNTSDSK